MGKKNSVSQHEKNTEKNDNYCQRLQNQFKSNFKITPTKGGFRALVLAAPPGKPMDVFDAEGKSKNDAAKNLWPKLQEVKLVA